MPDAQNSVRQRRIARDWSQQDLAARGGLSRAGVSAIEAGRLTPSVAAALQLAKALDCTVEELFTPEEKPASAIAWGIAPTHARARYWTARVGDELLGYPVEDDSPQLDWHDGVALFGNVGACDAALAERTLVIAGCDPAASLLAAEYARQFQFRLIVLRRSSRAALELLAAGKVHAAGVHLGQGGSRGAENSRAAKSSIGNSCHVVRVARWDEGLALNPQMKAASVTTLAKPATRWVGREEGSGARQCQDEVLAGRPAPRHVAFDHRSVAAAIRSGWADVGPCLRLTSEEAGLKFIKMHAKDYDLCFAGEIESDPRLAALLATLRSRRFRTRLAELPGYASDRTGELVG